MAVFSQLSIAIVVWLISEERVAALLYADSNNTFSWNLIRRAYKLYVQYDERFAALKS